MPVLHAEPDVFPELLFDRGDGAATQNRLWRVAHTRPRQEKCLARQLHLRGLPYYLPLVTRRRRIRGHFQTSYVPLFPSYVFVFGDREERLGILATNRVIRLLDVPDQEQLWQDLAQVKQLIASGAAITPEGRLVPGKLVEIRSGPLAGLRGKILRSATGRRFLVEVDFIHKGASVLLDDFSLVAVE